MPRKNGIYIQELGIPKRDLILKTATRAAFAPTGYLLFAREGMLYAQRLDLKDAKLTGDPIPLADDIRTNPTNGRAAFAVSQNGGVLVYHQQGTKIRQLTWYNRAGKRLGTVGEPGKYTVIRRSSRMKRKRPCWSRLIGLTLRPGLWISNAAFSHARQSTCNRRVLAPYGRPIHDGSWLAWSAAVSGRSSSIPER